MSTVPQRRLDFSSTVSDGLAIQLGEAVASRRQADKGGWTKRAVWYVEDDAVTAVVGEQEQKNVDDVLGFGLLKAGTKTLRLVLPETFAGPSLIRAAWFDHPVEVFTHASGTVSGPVNLSRDRTIAIAGDPEKKAPLSLPGVGVQLRALVDWAAEHPLLEAAHRADVRAWSHTGQRVLEIRGRKSPRVSVGIDAKTQPASSFTAKEIEQQAGITAVKALVEDGIDQARSKTFQEAEEHHLQARLRDHPGSLRLEHPVLREVPAFRPKGNVGERGRGFIDLLGLDGLGDIVVVETKLGGDHMLVLQGLDYWIWANKNVDWLRERLNASADAQVKILYAVAGKKGAAPSISEYAKCQLGLLSDQVKRSVVMVEQWKAGPITTVW